LRRDAHEPQEQLESELRVHLERGVPHLAAPGDRMRKVRRRAARHGRRRRALLTAVTGVLAVAVLAGPLRSHLGGAPAGTGTGSAAPVRDRSGVPSLRTLVVAGLNLRLRDNWHDVTVADARGHVHEFVVNRSLGSAGACPAQTTGNFWCAPQSALSRDEALISFRHAQPSGRASKDPVFALTGSKKPSNDCAELGGDQEIFGLGATVTSAGGTVATNTYICLREPSPRTLAEVKELLGTAAFVSGSAGPRSPAAPSTGGRPPGDTPSHRVED
jgi:hypothetical protein